MTDTAKQPGISVAQVFLEAATFAHRDDALALPAETKPDLGDLQVELEIGIMPDEQAGVVRIRVATDESRNPLYRVSVKMAGLFQVQPGQANMPLPDFLNGPALAFMYPFVREAFANITGRGRFGPVWLNPFNVHQAGADLASRYAAAKAVAPEISPNHD